MEIADQIENELDQEDRLVESILDSHRRTYSMLDTFHQILVQTRMDRHYPIRNTATSDNLHQIQDTKVPCQNRCSIQTKVAAERNHLRKESVVAAEHSPCWTKEVVAVEHSPCWRKEVEVAAHRNFGTDCSSWWISCFTSQG